MLGLALIDEGRFLVDADEDLSRLQQSLMEYRRTHGEKSKGAKAKLTIEVTLAIDEPADELFSIKAMCKQTLPARPASTSLAIADVDAESGLEGLFVKPSGSEPATPRQGSLATADGRGIDPETGKADQGHTLKLPAKTA